MLISARALGRRKPLFADWSIPLPPNSNGNGGEGGLTLRELIERIVLEEVNSFRRRQHDRQFLRVLTAAEIEEAADKGKIQMGQSEIPIQSVDDEQAVAAALQAFEDGLYMVVIDEVEQKNLDQQVFVTADSRITFIRLTLLSGG